MVPVIVLTLILSAFFSGIEIAFFSANKLRFEIDKNKGLQYTKILDEFYEKPSRFISTLLVGNNLALSVFGALMANLLIEDRFAFLPENELLLLLVQTLITTIIVLIFGEFFPKTLFRLQPDRILKFFSWPLRLVYGLLSPVSLSFSVASKLLITKILGLEYSTAKYDLTSADLEQFVRENAKSGEETEEEDSEIDTDIFEKALYLKDVKVRECMVPRTEIEAVEINISVDELKDKFVETRHSRLILYDDSIDNVVGYTHHFELLKSPKTVKDILFEIEVVPESMSARDLLYQFTRKQQSIARVIDEYGGTAGIVTLEDIIEEIFGEIRDEHDDEAYTENRLNEDTWQFSARLEIDYINEKYKLDIPTGDYETLAGYIMTIGEDLPSVGEELTLGNYQVKITEATDSKIETIHLHKIADESAE